MFFPNTAQQVERAGAGDDYGVLRQDQQRLGRQRQEALGLQTGAVGLERFPSSPIVATREEQPLEGGGVM